MKTAKEIEAEFRSDFDTLLRKYRASFRLEHESHGWFSDDVPTVFCDGEYDGDGNTTRECAEIRLDGYIRPEPIQDIPAHSAERDQRDISER